MPILSRHLNLFYILSHICNKYTLRTLYNSCRLVPCIPYLDLIKEYIFITVSMLTGFAAMYLWVHTHHLGQAFSLYLMSSWLAVLVRKETQVTGVQTQTLFMPDLSPEQILRKANIKFFSIPHCYINISWWVKLIPVKLPLVLILYPLSSAFLSVFLSFECFWSIHTPQSLLLAVFCIEVQPQRAQNRFLWYKTKLESCH